MHFQINKIDHVAIRAISPSLSVEWYSRILGCQAVKKEAWGDFPIMMLGDNICVAIFPANQEDDEQDIKKAKIDHFAFNVDRINFDLARKYFDKIGQPFSFQDHHYHHSIYLKDPDNHTVEFTTLILPDKDFGIPI